MFGQGFSLLLCLNTHLCQLERFPSTPHSFLSFPSYSLRRLSNFSSFLPSIDKTMPHPCIIPSIMQVLETGYNHQGWCEEGCSTVIIRADPRQLHPSKPKHQALPVPPNPVQAHLMVRAIFLGVFPGLTTILFLIKNNRKRLICVMSTLCRVPSTFPTSFAFQKMMQYVLQICYAFFPCSFCFHV